ncbi:MAG: class I SAM-dependent methyltransferase [Azospirillaceae bacterium]
MTTRSMFLPDPIHAYLLEAGLREAPALAALRAETAALPQAHYQIAPEEGQLLGFLIETTGARACLDVGTFTGYSALAMALAVGPDARIATFDVSEDFTAIARRHWAAAGVEGRIALELGPALDSLRRHIDGGEAGTWDLAFIDADKEAYGAYFEACLALLRPGGLIVVDNTLWRGRVADPEDRRAKTEAMRRFNADRHGDDRVGLLMIPIGDGVTVLRKRRAS